MRTGSSRWRCVQACPHAGVPSAVWTPGRALTGPVWFQFSILSWAYNAHSLPTRSHVACGAYESARCTGACRNTLDGVWTKTPLPCRHRDRRKQQPTGRIAVDLHSGRHGASDHNRRNPVSACIRRLAYHAPPAMSTDRHTTKKDIIGPAGPVIGTRQDGGFFIYTRSPY